MEEKEAIVFDEAFIRKAFKGSAFKKMFKLSPTSGYDMDGDGEISTREFKIVMKRSNQLCCKKIALFEFELYILPPYF